MSKLLASIANIKHNYLLRNLVFRSNTKFLERKLCLILITEKPDHLPIQGSIAKDTCNNISDHKASSCHTFRIIRS